MVWGLGVSGFEGFRGAGRCLVLVEVLCMLVCSML